MIGKQLSPRGFVRRIERPQVGVERRLRVDDDMLAAGQVDDDVRPQAALFAVDGLLLGEVTVLHHAGELDHAPQLQLAPAAADARALERIDQPLRLAAQLPADGIERRDALKQLRPFLHPAALGLLDFLVDMLQRLGHRGQQVLDGLLPCLDVSRGFGVGLLQAGFRQVQECAIVRLQRLMAEDLERLLESRLRVLIGLEPFGMHGPILLELGTQPRLGRPRSKPAHQKAKRHTNHQDGQGK